MICSTILSFSYVRLPNDFESRPFIRPSPSTSLLESHFPIHQPLRATASMTQLPQHVQQQYNDQKLEELKQHGISVEQISLRKRKKLIVVCFLSLQHFLVSLFSVRSAIECH